MFESAKLARSVKKETKCYVAGGGKEDFII